MKATPITGYAGSRSASTTALKWALLLVGLICAGCTSGVERPPRDQGTAEPAGGQPIDPDAPYPPAVVVAIESLAAELRVAPETIQVVSYEEVEWPDGCLGLPAAYEVCTQAVVPGWRVSLSVGGELRSFRVDAVGSEIREE